MIPITEFKGRDVAIFGLARTGLAAAKALTAGGARVCAWDDNDVARANAEAAGVPVTDINSRDWRSFAALVLSPDTGPLHLAVALDRPVVSLIGYSDPGRVGPYRKFHDLVIDAFHDPGESTTPITMAHRDGRVEHITVDEVMAKVRVWAQRYR